jgi:ABC-2 type transport system ATP-binding protein
VLLVAAGGSLLVAAPASAGSYTKQTVHIDTTVGPRGDQHCDVVADLYRPEGATRKNPAPAILTTNGFGGSKNDQAGTGRTGAKRGYVVLSYSGLGFGGSGCRIQLDDPDWDGEAGSDLITFLGGGLAAKDGTKVNYVARDKRGSDGKRHSFDPRVGMLGGSYGGQVQYAVASVDPRLDTIVPVITWNDLAYSLVPNNTDFTSGVTSATPGVPKFVWATLFFAVGELRGIEGLEEDISRISGGCPNFAPGVCPAFAKNALVNTPDDATLDLLRHASVSSYIKRIRIPTMVVQGLHDSLFNLNESVATYRSLQRQDVPVKLIWQSRGHSGGGVSGEFNGAKPAGTYIGDEVFGWFRHYLQGTGPKPDLDYCYFRDWVSYDEEGSAEKAYACASRYPVGRRKEMLLSADGSLAARKASVSSGSRTFLAPPEVPTSYSEISAIDPGAQVFDLPGTYTAFRSAPLRRKLDVAGVPMVHMRASAPLQPVTEVLGHPGETVVFLKLYDVGPDGEAELPLRQISPVRIPVTGETVKVDLPGIVHRFEKGHRLELRVAGSDLAYRGNIAPQVVTVTTDPSRPGVLSLPVLR